jgi:intraflagellar transport protein 46
VSAEVRELFEYIGRYKPQKCDLDTKLRPQVPDFIPSIGEVDAYLKMPKPDNSKEELGITQLDEPCLDCSDPTTLTMKYIQVKKTKSSAPIEVRSIEMADKNPKEISRWIKNVEDLHKSRPPPNVNYTKSMPDIEHLMQEWHPEMERSLQDSPFPGPDIDLHVNDYAKIICSILDIPIHKTANNKAVVEGLHVLFTLYTEFKQNQHFQQQEQNKSEGGAQDGFVNDGGEAMQF